MTREEAKELLPIIKAFADGKKVEFFNDVHEWEDSEYLEFSRERKRYRIKPEPKYRPFKSQEECWKEMQKHQPFGWIKNKKNGNFYCIGEVSWSDAYREVIITFSTSEMLQHSSVAVYNEYTFADGAPFGVVED